MIYIQAPIAVRKSLIFWDIQNAKDLKHFEVNGIALATPQYIKPPSHNGIAPALRCKETKFSLTINLPIIENK